VERCAPPRLAPPGAPHAATGADRRRGGRDVATEAVARVCAEIADILRRFAAEADLRPGAPADYAVAGAAPVATVAPRDEAAVAALVAGARAHRWALVTRGAGTRDRWGGAVGRAPAVAVETRHLTGIVAHEPGDLTVRVLSGTPVSALNAALRPHGQWLPLAPPRAAEATVGGTVAADAWGPTRLLHGGPRDLLLGLRCVDGGGCAFAAGAHVVKNVSGLDIGKLLVGSFGSLAILTQLSFKLRPLAPAVQFWAAAFESDDRAFAAARAILDGDFQPAGVAVRDGACAVWLEGGAAEVADQALRLEAVAAGGTVLPPEAAAKTWSAAAEPEAAGAEAVIVRCDVPEAQLEALAAAVAAMPSGPRRTAWVGLGALWCTLADDAARVIRLEEAAALVGRLRALAEAAGGRAVVAACPAAIRADVAPFGDPAELLPWMRALKARFDPDGVLAPGRFVGGL
jgi:glycolate oxidase FAD binding subunit